MVIDRPAMARQTLTGQTEADPVDITGSWRGEETGQTDRICRVRVVLVRASGQVSQAEAARDRRTGALLLTPAPAVGRHFECGSALTGSDRHDGRSGTVVVCGAISSGRPWVGGTDLSPGQEVWTYPHQVVMATRSPRLER